MRRCRCVTLAAAILALGVFGLGLYDRRLAFGDPAARIRGAAQS